ncbi:MAG TPA: LolA-related protein [Burkholderiaceae bacterium]|jgi:outer membrane lipoprotein-sorting protein|nr:LolA-related protein [Burkholderiaceae bacterium]
MDKIRKLIPLSLVLATALLSLSATIAHADAWDLSQLMAGLAQVQSHESRFTETKTIALLKNPIESSGVLRYRRPDHVEKQVLQPKDESIIVDGQQLLWKDGASGKTRTLSLQSNAVLAALVESIRATLAGDLPALQHFFAVKLDGASSHWTLSLTPLDKAMQGKVQTVRIEGSVNHVTLIDVTETGGDHSVMQIQND